MTIDIVAIPIINTSNKKSVSRKPNPIPAIKASILVIQAHTMICFAEIISSFFSSTGFYLIAFTII